MNTNEVQETYSMQFKDKIDEYLWKEHHIIGGSCSSIESLKYTVAREVAEKLNDTFVDKLTWKDMAEIVQIADILELEWLNYTNWGGIRDCNFYEEVLKRFKVQKGE